MWRDIEDLPQHLDLQNFVFEALNLDRVLQHEDRLRAGWWFQPLWKILFSRDDYSQYMETHKIPWFQTTNQKSHWGGFYVPKDGWFVENPRILDLDAIYAIYGDVKQPVCASIFDPK